MSLFPGSCTTRPFAVHVKSVATAERLIVLEAYGALSSLPQEVDALCNAVVYAVSRGSNVAIYAPQHNLYSSGRGASALRDQLQTIWFKVQGARGDHGDHLRIYHMERLIPVKPHNRGWDVATVEQTRLRSRGAVQGVMAFRTAWDHILHQIPAGQPIVETDLFLPYYIRMVRSMNARDRERKFPAANTWKTEGAIVEYDINRPP